LTPFIYLVTLFSRIARQEIEQIFPFIDAIPSLTVGDLFLRRPLAHLKG